MSCSSNKDTIIHPVNRVLIIPDGHRRWSRKHSVSYTEAYMAGGSNAARLIEGILLNGLCNHITLYLIASKNFEERHQENMESIFAGVNHLFATLSESSIVQSTVWNIRGKIFRLPPKLNRSLQHLLDVSMSNDSCNKSVEFLLDYSGKEELKQSIVKGEMGYIDKPGFDIIIRTGQIVRLSDAPIWESTRSDMFLIDKLFPDVELQDIVELISRYRNDKLARKSLSELENQEYME